MAKIRIENITKIYGRTPRQQPLKMLRKGESKDEIFRKTRHVVGLDNVTFDIDEGEIFVVMGLSGSGKSTLIRCVNRLLEPTDGEIWVDDTNVTKLGKKELRALRRKRMAMVFQHFALFPHKSVIYNVAYGLTVRGTPESEWRERALNALTMVGLRDWADHYPHNLSGGMQQRVGLARALATDADILLMDEAFSALDPLIRREMQDELMELQKKLQKTILFITHDLGEALRVGNRVAIMRDGAVVQIGTPQEIITEPADDYVAEFMADVDSGRVLTAEFIMSPADPVQVKKHTVRDALRRMDKKETVHLYVIDDKYKVQGLLHRHRLEALDDKGIKEFERVIDLDYPRAPISARLNELYELSTSGEPIVIVNERGNYQGVVYPLHIFSALSLGIGTENDEGDTTKNEPVLESISEDSRNNGANTATDTAKDEVKA